MTGPHTAVILSDPPLRRDKIRVPGVWERAKTPGGAQREAQGEAQGIPSTARSMMVGQFFVFPGSDGRLPIRSRCGRVYD